MCRVCTAAKKIKKKRALPKTATSPDFRFADTTMLQLNSVSTVGSRAAGTLVMQGTRR